MKCTNCGNENANFHYRTNINGKITEEHLCSECAQSSGYERNFFEETERMFNGFFDDFFTGFPSFMGLAAPSRMRTSFMPRMFMPAVHIVLHEPKTERKTEEEKTEHTAADPELSLRREMNRLRRQMKKAADEEDYETAAKLRDELRALSDKKGE